MKKGMVTATKLINLLADGHFHSGEKLAEALTISRAAINKQIKGLGELGLTVFSVQGKGYCLAQPLSLLDQQQIADALSERRTVVLPMVDSTNQYLLERISELNSGDICVAEYQSAGRGRRGRQWLSPFGSNLYFSLYWHFPLGVADLSGLSLVIGIVLAESLQQSGVHAIKVKWPNDLYLSGKKIAGILVELVGKMNDSLHMIIGCGLNIGMQKDNYSERIEQLWTSLQQERYQVDRNQLVIALAQNLSVALQQFAQQGLAAFLHKWPELDYFWQKPVRLLLADKVIMGIDCGINEQGALLLRQQDGSITPYMIGEISLRDAEDE